MDVNVSLCLAIIDLAIDPFIESSHGVIWLFWYKIKPMDDVGMQYAYT
jgi:hypothetical protein